MEGRGGEWRGVEGRGGDWRGVEGSGGKWRMDRQLVYNYEIVDFNIPRLLNVSRDKFKSWEKPHERTNRGLTLGYVLCSLAQTSACPTSGQKLPPVQDKFHRN